MDSSRRFQLGFWKQPLGHNCHVFIISLPCKVVMAVSLLVETNQETNESQTKHLSGGFKHKLPWETFSYF